MRGKCIVTWSQRCIRELMLTNDMSSPSVFLLFKGCWCLYVLLQYYKCCSWFPSTPVDFYSSYRNPIFVDRVDLWAWVRNWMKIRCDQKALSVRVWFSSSWNVNVSENCDSFCWMTCHTSVDFLDRFGQCDWVKEQKTTYSLRFYNTLMKSFCHLLYGINAFNLF